MSNAEAANLEPVPGLASNDEERRQQYIGRGWWASIPLTIVPAYQLTEGQMRLDAGFYAEGVAAALRVVADCKLEVKPLGEVVKEVFILGRFRRVYATDKNAGWPYLSASEALEFRPSSERWIARDHAPRHEKRHFAEPGWLLVSASGSVGRVAFATERLSKYFLTHDLLRIAPSPSPLSGYLYAYLSTWIGQALIAKDQYGSAIKHLEPHHLSKVPIPILPENEQQAIHGNIERAWKLRDEANDLLDEADAMLHDELGLPHFSENLIPYLPPPKQSKPAIATMPHPQAFTLKSSELNERFDVSYHVPVVKVIKTLLQDGKHEAVRLDSMATGIRIPPRFKRIYVKKEFGVPFLRPSHLPQVRPYDLGYISHLTPVLNQLRLNEGEVLITTDGTVGRVGLVSSRTDGWAGSNNIARVIYSKDDARNGYLAAFLSTPYGFHQLAREIFGGVVDHIEESQIRSVLIPNPPAEIQTAIGNLFVKAFEKKDEASALESITIRECEIALMNTNDQVVKLGQKPAESQSEADRFKAFVKKVVSVPKEEIDKRQAEYEAKKTERKQANK